MFDSCETDAARGALLSGALASTKDSAKIGISLLTTAVLSLEKEGEGEGEGEEGGARKRRRRTEESKKKRRRTDGNSEGSLRTAAAALLCSEVSVLRRATTLRRMSLLASRCFHLMARGNRNRNDNNNNNNDDDNDNDDDDDDDEDAVDSRRARGALHIITSRVHRFQRELVKESAETARRARVLARSVLCLT